MKRSDSPTLRAIAKAAKVSHVTVSLALRDDPRLPVPTRARIKKLAARMGYRRKPLLSMAMAQMRLRFPQRLITNLAFISPVGSLMTNEFPYAPRLAGAEERARELGFGVEMILIEEPQPRKVLIDQLQARGVQGIIILGSMEFPWRSDLNALLDHFPAVYLGGPYADWPRLHESCTDPFALGYGLARHIAPCKFRSIACCLESIQGAEEFGHGFNAGCHSVGAKAPRLNRRLLDSDSVDPQSVLRWFHQNRPDAIITTSSTLDIWLKAGGVRIPEEVSLFHWNPPEGWSGWDNRNRELGAAAVDLAVGQLYRGEKGTSISAVRVTLSGFFVQGRTSRPISSNPVNWQSGYSSAIQAPAASWQPLDLSAQFNSDYIADWTFPLLHFSPGNKFIHSVPFTIGHPGRMDVHPCLQLDPEKSSDPNKPVQVTIPVGRRVTSVYFLHLAVLRDPLTAKKIQTPGFPEYHFQFASGATERQPPVIPAKKAPRDITPILSDWWPHDPPRDFPPHARYLAVKSDNALETYERYLFTLAWENPRPNDLLTAIQITMPAQSIFKLTVFGITLQLGVLDLDPSSTRQSG